MKNVKDGQRDQETEKMSDLRPQHFFPEQNWLKTGFLCMGRYGNVSGV